MWKWLENYKKSFEERAFELYKEVIPEINHFIEHYQDYKESLGDETKSNTKYTLESYKYLYIYQYQRIYEDKQNFKKFQKTHYITKDFLESIKKRFKAKNFKKEIIAIHYPLLEKINSFLKNSFQCQEILKKIGYNKEFFYPKIEVLRVSVTEFEKILKKIGYNTKFFHRTIGGLEISVGAFEEVLKFYNKFFKEIKNKEYFIWIHEYKWFVNLNTYFINFIKSIEDNFLIVDVKEEIEKDKKNFLLKWNKYKKLKNSIDYDSFQEIELWKKFYKYIKKNNYNVFWLTYSIFSNFSFFLQVNLEMKIK